MKTEHSHSFDSIKLVNLDITGRAEVDDKLPEQYRFAGIGTILPTLGKVQGLAILIRYCDCGKEIAFDMLERGQAHERLEQLIGG